MESQGKFPLSLLRRIAAAEVLRLLARRWSWGLNSCEQIRKLRLLDAQVARRGSRRSIDPLHDQRDATVCGIEGIILDTQELIGIPADLRDLLRSYAIRLKNAPCGVSSIC